MSIRLRNGIFLAPFHPIDEDPTLCLHRDLELIEHLDRLGYEEAWVGEHHSAGYEIIASPELFIAAAAERTQRIKLGTGVVSLPYHNPLTTANRIVQLDHQTRGRVMFGVGSTPFPNISQLESPNNTVVRLQTNFGDIDLEMFDSVAPGTVTNFLHYVRDGDYDQSFFHRFVRDFVLQGGGFRFDNATPATPYHKIPTDPPITNEFQRSNTARTIAIGENLGNAIVSRQG